MSNLGDLVGIYSDFIFAVFLYSLVVIYVKHLDPKRMDKQNSRSRSNSSSSSSSSSSDESDDTSYHFDYFRFLRILRRMTSSLSIFRPPEHELAMTIVDGVGSIIAKQVEGALLQPHHAKRSTKSGSPKQTSCLKLDQPPKSVNDRKSRRWPPRHVKRGAEIGPSKQLSKQLDQSPGSKNERNAHRSSCSLM